MRAFLKRFATAAAILVVSFVVMFAVGWLRADTAYVDGVKVEAVLPYPSYGGTTNIAYQAATNVVLAFDVGVVRGSTGITNIWTGGQAAYDAIPVKDSKTLYFIEE